MPGRFAWAEKSKIAPDPSFEHHAAAAGWRCTMETDDCLLVATVGLPRGAEWRIELQDDRWDRPHATSCSDATIALQLPRGTKYAPVPTEPLRLKVRCAMASHDSHHQPHWSEWTQLAEQGTTDFIPVGFEELSPALKFFSRGRAPPGQIHYGELHETLRSLGLDPTTEIATQHVERYGKGSATMVVGEFVQLVAALRRTQLEAHDGVLKLVQEQLTAREKELKELRARLEHAERLLKVAPDIRAAFERYDRDKSGKLDYREVRSALADIGIDMTMNEAASVLRQYDADQSGRMEIDEFAQLVVKLRQLGYELKETELQKLREELKRLAAVAELAERAQRVAPDIRAAFERYDKDRSGRLDHREVRAALKDIGIDFTSEQAARVVKQYDADGSGQMEIDEFAQLVQKLRQMGYNLKEAELEQLRKDNEQLRRALKVAPDIRAAFARYDRDNSGRLDYQELRNALQDIGLDCSMEQAANAIRQYDNDRSGQMEIDEFAQLVQKLRQMGYNIKEAELEQLRKENEELRRALKVAPDIRAAFERYDRDRSGRLSHRELQDALKDIGVDVSHDQARSALSRYDRDRSGQMEIDEFAQLVEALRKMGYDLREADNKQLRARIEQQEGELGRLREELKRLKDVADLSERAARVAPDIRAAFERYDRNRNGRLDNHELRGALNDIGVGYSSEQATSLLQQYDTDRSGQMEIDEFARLVERLRQLGYELKDGDIATLRRRIAELERALRVAPDVRAAFERYDRDRNGSMDYKEVHSALQDIGLDPTMQSAQAELQKFDADRSGKMEIYEFAELVNSLRRLGYDIKEGEIAKLRKALAAAERAQRVAPDIRAAFERYDRDRSGKIDKTELRGALQEIQHVDFSLESAAAMLQQFDADKSGQMELDEFAQLVLALRSKGYEIKEGEIAQLRARLGGVDGELAAMRARANQGRSLASVVFKLRGVELAALDRKVLSKNSSDPYYVLQGRDAAGVIVNLAKSNRVNKNVNPAWEAVEVSVEKLGSSTHLRVEVYDHDTVTKDDLIGVAEMQLPDLGALFASGRAETTLETLALSNPRAKQGSAAAINRGTVEGSFTLVEKSAHTERENARLRAEVTTQASELSVLRAKLGGTHHELAGVQFALRGVELAALDRKVLSKSSSDPYYVLHGLDANGHLHEIGKSNTVMKELNPTWEAVEVTAETLGASRRLKVEVWDHDAVTKDDLIGEAEFELPDLPMLLMSGQAQTKLEPMVLANPKAKQGSSAAINRGTVEGSLTLLEKSDLKERELARLGALVVAKDQEIAMLRGNVAPGRGSARELPSGRELTSVAFSLRGANLLAMDRKRFGSKKASSDPYYTLQGINASGNLVQIAKSNVMMKNLSPAWDVVEVTAAQLGLAGAGSGLRSLRIEVYDYDKVTQNDLIGAADIPLPDLAQQLLTGPHQSMLQTVQLSNSNKPGVNPGTVEGSYTLLEKGAGLRDRELARLTAEVNALRGGQQLPQSPAAPPPQSPVAPRTPVAAPYGVPADVRAAFDKYDRNHNGKLDFVELRSVLTDMGIDYSIEQVERVLRDYDADGSGQMEIDEFAQLVQRLRTLGYHLQQQPHPWNAPAIGQDVQSAFSKYDRNKNGRLDYVELRAALEDIGINYGIDEAQKLLQKYDTNQSGQMEIEEFKQLVDKLRQMGYNLKHDDHAPLLAQSPKPLTPAPQHTAPPLPSQAHLALAGTSAVFTLKGIGLAAMDRKILRKNTSDPFYVLQHKNANGVMQEIGRSNIVNKNLNPMWAPCEVSSDKLTGVTMLHLDVWDHDSKSNHDLIGSVDILMPNLVSMMSSGQMEARIQAMKLSNPAKPGTNRGTIEGTVGLKRSAATVQPPPLRKS